MRLRRQAAGGGRRGAEEIGGRDRGRGTGNGGRGTGRRQAAAVGRPGRGTGREEERSGGWGEIVEGWSDEARRGTGQRAAWSGGEVGDEKKRNGGVILVIKINLIFIRFNNNNNINNKI